MRHIQIPPLVKHSQFLFFSHKTLWKWLPHEMIIFTKFHEDRTKNVNFRLMVDFWTYLIFFLRLYCRSFVNNKQYPFIVFSRHSLKSFSELDLRSNGKHCFELHISNWKLTINSVFFKAPFAFFGIYIEY